MKKHNIDELFDSILPKQINLKSFKQKDTLNTKIWKDGVLDSNIRHQLIEIARSFYKTLDIDWAQPKDIIFVGSLAAYNWSKYSDIDLHILMDLSDVDENIDLVKNYFQAKKSAWNEQHEMLNIYGYPVELYVQDINEENASNGVYSIKYNHWIKIPTPSKDTLDKKLIKNEAAKIINKVDKYCEKFNEITDDNKLLKFNDAINNLYDTVIQGRKDGIKQYGESAPGNIVFKILRRSGHLEKLHNLKYHVFDKINSILNNI